MSDRTAVITTMQQSNEDGVVVMGDSDKIGLPMKLMASQSDSEFIEFTARSHGHQSHPLAHKNMIHNAQFNIISPIVEERNSS